MADADAKKLYPAYIAYKTFHRFLKGLQPGNLPSSINSSVLVGMSGSSQSATLKTLEFLRLTADGKPTAKLEALVAAQGPDFATELSKVLHDAYGFIFASGLDIRRCTTQDVVEAFRKQGISGSTTVKAIAFFLAACKDAKIEVSKYVRTPTLARPANGTKKASAKGSDDGDEADEEEEEDEPERRSSGGGLVPDIDPALAGLLIRLPVPGEPITQKDRERFVAFFRSVLDLMYPEKPE